LKSKFSEEKWEKLLRINRIITKLYGVFTKPIIKYASKIITRLPLSNFFFRPLFLDEIYMALGFWEPYVRKNLPLSNGDIFVDIGAHIGYYTVYASQKVGKDGLVIAIEPDRRNLKVLYRNIGERKNVLVYEAAVGQNGFLYVNQQENPLYTKTTRERHDNKHYGIPSISLDSLLEKVERINFHSVVVKIDVEGAELDVIKGGQAFLKKISPTLIIECTNPSKIKSFLKQFGYTFEKLYGSYFIFYKNAS